MEHRHHHGQECCGHEHREHGHQGQHGGEAPEGCGCESGGEQGCCGQGGGFQRRFRSREELVAQLEVYRKDLQEELKAVEERIADLRSAG